MSIREQIQNDYRWRARGMSAVCLIEQTFEKLGLLDADFYATYATYGDSEWSPKKGTYDETPYIKLEPKHIPGIALGFGPTGPTLALTDTTPTLGDAARVLLPKVGAWKKSFDETANLIRLTAGFNGVRLILEDTPPDTCTVEKIEEEVEVPERVIAAHVEKKIRYVLKGDCDPLLTARDTQSEAVSA